jgi:predicted MFS family arabinose efflux permease
MTRIRLVPQRQVPRALAIFNGGNALATVVAAPLGSYLGATLPLWCALTFHRWQANALPDEGYHRQRDET